MTANKAFAEVIESSLQGFIAQSWQWDTFPHFGSMVMIEAKKRNLIGIVHQINTGSMDPTRYPFPYQMTEEQLQKEQPQIFAFLKTTFTCVTIGYQEQGNLFYQLPPEPAKIHAFVQPMPIDLSKQFFYKERYLHTLFGFANSIANFDELLLAILKYQASLNILTEDKVSSFMQTLSLLTGNDYRRLKLFLQRVEPIIEQHLH
ncbi:MAG TPA: hypothetical protein VFF04_00170 [Candidatus Babeliales bacterium]|nr:hypothetical protein [Candidatus Babeliales bacterium]